MKRHELEHVIRAVCAVADVAEIVVIGSQSILGQFPNAPDVLLQSQEADIFPKDLKLDTKLIDGALGEKSAFHQKFGYYVRGLKTEPATLPQGVLERLTPLRNENTRHYTGWCIDAHDLALSRLAVGAEPDRDFVIALHQYRMINPKTMLERMNHMPVGVDRSQVQERWQNIAKMR
jgi:hypothetical protein